MENTEQINSLIELFTIAHYSDDIEDVKKIFISVAKFYENNHRHQYYKISKYVYEKMNQEPDSLSYILNNISKTHRNAKKVTIYSKM